MESYNKEDYSLAMFAGGCFWCMLIPFKVLEGVVDVISGYTGGKIKNPTYEEVSTGLSGHVEVVQVVYDPEVTSYEELLGVFWRQINPTDPDGQFADRGSQYVTAIYYYDEKQRIEAEASKQELMASNRFSEKIMTEIKASPTFYEAEAYHQNFHKTHPFRYNSYRNHSGRDQFIAQIWKKKD